MKNIILIALLIFFCNPVYSQHYGISFQNAEKQNISLEGLESQYTSAVNVDTSKAVFKTDSAQEAMYNAYVKMLTDLGKFLKENNFNWEKVTKGYNRIYFNKDGTIDYFIYNFHGPNVKPENLISEEKEKEFDRLLNIFIQNYNIGLTADIKFAQCSPVTFNPAKKK